MDKNLPRISFVKPDVGAECLEIITGDAPAYFGQTECYIPPKSTMYVPRPAAPKKMSVIYRVRQFFALRKAL